MAAAAASAALVPTLLVKNFKNLSWLSMLGFAGAVLVTAVVLSLLPLDLHRTKMPQQVGAQFVVMRLLCPQRTWATCSHYGMAVTM